MEVEDCNLNCKRSENQFKQMVHNSSFQTSISQAEKNFQHHENGHDGEDYAN